jgi:hypothetical protein
MDCRVVKDLMAGYEPLEPMTLKVQELRRNLLELDQQIDQNAADTWYMIPEVFDTTHHHLEYLFFYCTKDFPNSMPINEFPEWYGAAADIVMGPGDVKSKIQRILKYI